MNALPHLLEPHDEPLRRWLAEHGQGAYRAAQVRKWLYEKRAESFDDMTDLGKELRSQLAADFRLWTTQIAKHSVADDGTEKLLLALNADQSAPAGEEALSVKPSWMQRIECVLLRDEARRTICISSQVGCAMGCVFCASGLDGVERNLTSGEIVEQMLRLARLLPPEERLSHIVVMGMGEPLANLDRLLPALEMASREDGLGISPRRITISTVGLPPAIDRLSEMNARFHLAVSLHAPDDELRSRLVPVNKNIGLAAILKSADHYFAVSGRRLTFEYVLLAEINDQPEHAHKLAKLLRGRPALLNVIPYNPVAGLPYRTPTGHAIKQFREILEQAGINVQFRHRKGDKINAACGQLRRSTPLGAVKLPPGEKVEGLESIV
jgi:23S rRNA (adenine2503-C2)-methyltransferase